MKKIYSYFIALMVLTFMGKTSMNAQCLFTIGAGSGTASTTIGAPISVYSGQDANGIHGHYISVFLHAGYQYQFKQYVYSGCCFQSSNTGYFVTITDSANNILQNGVTSTYFTFSTKVARTIRVHISHTPQCISSTQSTAWIFYLDVTPTGRCPNSYRDLDGDGYGNPNDSLLYDACPLPTAGYVTNNTDCDDNNVNAHAIAQWYVDNDGDGFGAASDPGIASCGNPASRFTIAYANNNLDCDDNNPLIGPHAVEIYGNNIDENCDGLLTPTDNALNFNGGYIEVANNASIDFDSTYTIEMLINRNSGQYLTLIDKASYDYLLQVQNNKLAFYANASSWIVSNDTVPTGQWVHVAITHDQYDTLRFYIDGQLSGAFGNVITQHSTGSMNVGRQGPANCQCWPFLGSMDEVRLWKVARTQAELNTNKNISLCGHEDGLVLYYKFDQGVADDNNTTITTARDLSSYNNTGTLVNFPLNGNSGNFVTGLTIPPAFSTGSILASTDTVCTGDTLVLSGTGASIYYWSTNVTPGVSFTPTSADTYYMLAVDARGCSNMDSIIVPVLNCQATQTISFPAIADRYLGDPDFTLNASASSGLPVTYTSSDPLVATISGNTVTITGVGATTITASQAGDASWLAAADEQQTLTVLSPVGLQNNVLNNDVLVYPNPAHDLLNIRLSGSTTNALVSITNSIGEKVYEGFCNEKAISVSNFSSGLYHLTILKEGKIKSTMFVVE